MTCSSAPSSSIIRIVLGPCPSRSGTADGTKGFDETRRAGDPGRCRQVEPARFETAVTQHSRNTPQFYLTAPSPCPYLPGQEERKVFTHLVGERAGELNDLLTHGGFRRSQSIAYRPACETCRACVSVRVVAFDFRPTRSMRRILERNRDLVGELRVAVPTSEQYSVFRSYLDARHRDGGMADMSVLDYALMVEASHVDTRIVEYRRRGPDSAINGRGAGELIAVALTDVLSDGLSMVYSFFDSDEAARSL